MDRSRTSPVYTTMPRRLWPLALTVAACASPPPATRTSSRGAPPPASATAAPSAPSTVATTPRARVDLLVRKSSYFIGENVLVDYCVVNTDRAPLQIHVGGDSRGSPRSLRFKVQVCDTRGVAADDPYPNPLNFGGLGYSPRIAPGDRWCQSLPLMRYARVDAPGTYTIRATHDLGWGVGEVAPSGEATINFEMPTATQAEAVIAAMEALPVDVNASAGKPSADFQDYSTLRQEIYLAPLAARAAAGRVYAIAGLAEIPTEGATRALVALLSHANADVARAAARGLALRLPDPALSGALGKRNPFEDDQNARRRYLSSRAWVESLAGDVRAAAKARLASSEMVDQVDGAFMLEAVGAPLDGPDLTRALDAAIARTRSVPAETGVYPVPRGACGELLRAADALVTRGFAPEPSPRTLGETAIWLVALSRATPPPKGDAPLERALKHRVAYVRQLAMERVPHGALPARLVPLVAANLANPDADVVVAAAQLAERETIVSLAQDVARAMHKVRGLRLNVVGNAAQALGARVERADALIALLAKGDAFDDAVGELVQLLDVSGQSSDGETPDAERAALAAQWRSFVAAHRAQIRAGAKIPTTDPGVTRDLVPSSWKLRRADGSEWP